MFCMMYGWQSSTKATGLVDVGGSQRQIDLLNGGILSRSCLRCGSSRQARSAGGCYSLWGAWISVSNASAFLLGTGEYH